VQLLKGLAADARPKRYQGRTYQFLEKTWSGFYLVNDRTLVYGSEDALVYLFDHLARKQAAGPLQAGLQLAGGEHHMVLGLNAQLLAQGPAAQGVPPQLQPLLNAQVVTAALDLGKETRLDVRVHFSQEEQARAGEKAVQAGLEMARAALANPIQEVERQLFKEQPKGAPTGLQELPEAVGGLFALGMLRQFEAELKKVAVTRQGTIVRAPLTAPSALGGSGAFPVVAFAAISTIGHNANGTFGLVATKVASGGDTDKPLEDNLFKLGAAFNKYHADHGHFPAPAITDKSGQALLSWRVALLPYLGEDELYRQFKQDEPWDSLHNKRLLKKMPKVLRDPKQWRMDQPWWTRDLVFTGPGTVFEGTKGIRRADVHDGVDKTLLLVHVPEEQSVYWTKPADLVYSADKPLPTLAPQYAQRFHVVLANGTVRVLKRDIPEKTLRALITRNGGERVDVPD
jgi:hypothetical protein